MCDTVDDSAALAVRFEAERPRLRSVAYRMLGSLSEADDAVQETWLRLGRVDAAEVRNLAAWLTTVVGRVCLNVLRARERRREDPLDVRLPDPLIGAPESGDPQEAAELADAVGLAMMVVLETLEPGERVAFVLHDMFGVPFDVIAALLERSPAAARQAASRARRRVREGTPVADPDPARRRAVVNAFFAAARDGDLDGLVAVLAPDVVLRSDDAAGRGTVVSGARDVAGRAVLFNRLAAAGRLALVDGAPAVVVVHRGRPVSVMVFTVSGGRIAAVHVLADPARLPGVTAEFLGG
ncbi:sigma-70 family RNA polymerase sigma factor [Streptomyces avicenniae]|uniref:sigma-70 family RNA polymerase sigma factor n=1 Tax=Streptomyces avicenniae TaxID=500153 RepID=UPI00069C8664|nr:sigma-70 family RNA polymerase sigma factor [Streptomyces avicenniae]